MNIVESFKEWMEDNGFGAFGTDLYTGGVPLEAPDDAYWITASGGSNIGKNVTGEKQKNYILNIYYRSSNQENIYDKLQAIEEALNTKECIELEAYTVIEVETTAFPVDQDIDNEDRSVGLIQATITAYQTT